MVLVLLKSPHMNFRNIKIEYQNITKQFFNSYDLRSKTGERSADTLTAISGVQTYFRFAGTALVMNENVI